MEQVSMTALVSAFARAYHATHNTERIFNDSLAKLMLTEDEYKQIANSMTQGIRFFNPSFLGTDVEALRWIVDNQLSPSPLGRAAFAEKALEDAVKLGARQCLILAAGYDTFGYRQPEWAKDLRIFELDRPDMLADKRKRLQRAQLAVPSNVHFVECDFTEDRWEDALLCMAAFEKESISFCSLLGISYYLSKQSLKTMISKLSALVPDDSMVVLDYPDDSTYTKNAGERTKRQVAMASGANEKMLAGYSPKELAQLLEDHDFLVVEHLTPNEITKQFFQAYNDANPMYTMSALENVNLCLARKSTSV